MGKKHKKVERNSLIKKQTRSKVKTVKKTRANILYYEILCAKHRLIYGAKLNCLILD